RARMERAFSKGSPATRVAARPRWQRPAAMYAADRHTTIDPAPRAVNRHAWPRRARTARKPGCPCFTPAFVGQVLPPAAPSPAFWLSGTPPLFQEGVPGRAGPALLVKRQINGESHGQVPCRVAAGLAFSTQPAARVAPRGPPRRGRMRNAH